MSDDLKRRLRRRWPNEDPKTQAEKREAADRIEELEAKLAEMTQAWLQACDVTDLAGKLVDAEAKIARMLEIVRSRDTGYMRREDTEARCILEKLEAVVKETPSA